MSRLLEHVRLISLQPAPDHEVLVCLKLRGQSERQIRSLLAVFPPGSVTIFTGADGTYFTFYANQFAKQLGGLEHLPNLESVLAELSWILKICSNPFPFVWHCRDRQIDLRYRTAIIGVLNCTPDSFSDGGEYFRPQDALAHALQMVAVGADIIDIGGESTRPGAVAVSEQEEMERVLPVIESLRRESDVPISIDTYKSSVARAAVQVGADIINDISGANFDPLILDVAKEFRTGLVLMHIQGDSQTMQIAPTYTDVVEEILVDLAGKVERALAAGIEENRLIIDPGIGFGKRWYDNYDILNRLVEFRILSLPILVGVSRKSFLGKFLSPQPHQRLEGSLIANGVAVGNGANILRVHDVAETRKAVRMADLFYRRAWGGTPEILEEQFQ